VWSNSDERMDAREILDENLKALAQKDESRHRLMENSSRVEGPYFAHSPQTGRALKFQYRIRSLNSGHNMPSGSLGAQPQLWFNAVLTGPQGQHLWESGYVDANGDIADVHSLEVAAGRIRRDTQLVNLQTKFLITHVKGTDREMALPINVDIDQLPFIRPSGFPITVLNHPPLIRMEAHSIPPLGARVASYRVPAKFLREPGPYRLSVRMRFRAEPIYFMRLCRCTPEMERSMNESMLNFHEQSYDFYVR
ncbi:MAG TPA: cytochrome C, partial [Pirellulaceae bacterium]